MVMEVLMQRWLPKVWQDHQQQCPKSSGRKPGFVGASATTQHLWVEETVKFVVFWHAQTLPLKSFCATRSQSKKFCTHMKPHSSFYSICEILHYVFGVKNCGSFAEIFQRFLVTTWEEAVCRPQETYFQWTEHSCKHCLISIVFTHFSEEISILNALKQ